MAKRLIRQINRLKIYRDIDRPKREEYQVVAPNGIVLEGFSKLSSAVHWARKIYDFVIRPRKSRRKK